MSFVNERKAIEKRLRDNFDSFIVPIQYENISTLKKGTETIKDTNDVDKFVRLTITGSGAEQRDVGGNADRHFGLITVQILVKSGLGSNLARKIADEIYYIYNRASFGECITCQSSTIETFPENADGWYQINVVTPFYRDQEYTPPVLVA
jgi:hypothetical protein